MISSSTQRPDYLTRIRARNAKKAAVKHKQAQAKAARLALRHPSAVLSPATRERLLAEAVASPAFEGMEPTDIRTYLDGKIADYLAVQPWWFGRSDDTKHHAHQRSYALDHGFIEAAPLSEGLVRYNAERRQERESRAQRIATRINEEVPA